MFLPEQGEESAQGVVHMEWDFDELDMETQVLRGYEEVAGQGKFQTSAEGKAVD